jgi:hypothetical protein
MIRATDLLFLLFLANALCGQSQWTENERQTLIAGLKRSEQLVLNEVANLNSQQWTFRENAGRWSIAEIVEHLGLQEDMYFREIYLIAQQPAQPSSQHKVKGNDTAVLGYATDPERGQASWFLEPKGRWPDPRKALEAFSNSRHQLVDFVRNTKVDLREHFTFRSYSGTQNQWSVRDLHQLMLTTIAHTERHVGQIQKLKADSRFPLGNLELTANERAYLRDHLRMTSRFLVDTAKQYTDQQLVYKPAPNRWSIAQCIDHLARNEEYIVNLIKTKMLKHEGPLRDLFPSLAQNGSPAAKTPDVRRMTRLEDGPTYLQMTDRTRAAYTAVEQRPPIGEVAPPDVIEDPQGVLRRFFEVRAATIAYVTSTKDDLRGHYGEARLFLFPEVQQVQDAYQWLLRMSAHTERHLMQIHEVEESPGFPAK